MGLLVWFAPGEVAVMSVVNCLAGSPVVHWRSNGSSGMA